MELTQLQKVALQKARILATGQYPITLDNQVCTYLLAVIVDDLDLHSDFPQLPVEPLPLFASTSLDDLKITGIQFLPLLERLLDSTRDAITYFACLAELLKRRVKYERILETQPIPTIDQVGPRALLQYGNVSPAALAGLLMWRKWIFDIDNRAGQESGYLFEPIIANAIGGVPYSAAKSPIRRHGRGTGRQVDCLLVDSARAYEFKLRITIAASGQGRWSEELEFPADCRASGYTPVILVLDPTPNPKLTQIQRAFLAQEGEAYVGAESWHHLQTMAGPTMSRFLEKYVREPIDSILREVPETPLELPEIVFAMQQSQLTVNVRGQTITISRHPELSLAEEPYDLANDVDEETISP